MQDLLPLPTRRVIVLIAALLVLVVATGAASASAAFTPGKYRITTGATGFNNALDAAGGVIDNGTRVINWPRNGTSAQEWYIDQTSATPGGTPLYSVHPASNRNFCLDINSASQAEGTNVWIWRCHFGPNQQFFIRFNATSQAFIARHSGKALNPDLAARSAPRLRRRGA